MKQLLWKHWKRKGFSYGLMVLALVLVFSSLPISITSLQHAHRQVESDITYYSRGSYDLLVRSKENIHPLEEQLGIVPENYIGFGNGGISIEQWNNIKNREDIEIAAPVASLGYFPGINSNMSVYPPETSTRYLAQFYTFDGVHQYPYGKEYACIHLESTIKQYPFQSLTNDEDSLNQCYDGGRTQFLMPPTFHLLVGIDPEQEERLTGISFNGIHPESMKVGWGTLWKNDYIPHAKVVPILEVKSDPVSLGVNVQVDTLDLSLEEIQQFRKDLKLDVFDEKTNTVPDYYTFRFYEPVYTELLNKLLTMKALDHKSYSVPIGEYIQAFDQSKYSPFLTKEGKIESLLNEQIGMFEEGYHATTKTSYLGLHYQAGHVTYELDDHKVKIKKIRDDQGIPIYREMIQKGKEVERHEDYEDISVVIDPVGEVEVGEHREKLASSPLGIYQFAPVYFVGDGKEKKKKMMPTVSPGSFVSPPAQGVTNMEGAAIIKGNRPIDAIRVKVAGLDGYTEEAKEKIEKVAKEIEQMGLHVTIVAGASPKKLQVDVEGIGLVEESWTTLGAAGTIVSEWSATNLILGVLFILVAFIYIWNRMIFWQVSKQSEWILFSHLGWNRNHIFRLSRLEIISVLFVSFIISIPTLWSVQKGMELPSTIYIWHPIMLAVMLLFMIISIYWKIKGIEKRNENRNISWAIRNKHHFLVIKNILYYAKYIRSSFLQLLLVSALSSFVYVSLTETVNRTNTTLLGQFINTQISSWHVVLIIIAYLLAFFTLAESLMSMVKVREKELAIFKAIGWKKSHILKLHLKEVMIWSFTSIFLGTMINGLFFSFIYSLNTAVAFTLFLSMVSFFFLVILISWIQLRIYLRKFT